MWAFLLEWSATAVLIISICLTSWNIYPTNLWVSLVANILWFILGFVWRKWSLIVVEAIVIAILVAGILKTIQ